MGRYVRRPGKPPRSLDLTPHGINKLQDQHQTLDGLDLLCRYAAGDLVGGAHKMQQLVFITARQGIQRPSQAYQQQR